MVDFKNTRQASFHAPPLETMLPHPRALHGTQIKFLIFFVLSSFFVQIATAQEVFSTNQPQPELDQFSVAARCPLSCSKDGNWALYSDVNDLASCNKTVLLELNLYTEISHERPDIGIRSCVVDAGPSSLKRRQTFVVPNGNSTPSVFDDNSQTADITLLRNNGNSDATHVQSAILALANYLQNTKDGSTAAFFAKSGDTIIGVYGGSQIKKSSLSALVRDLPKQFNARDVKQVAAQYCKEDALNTQIFGAFIDTSGDLAAVQKALRELNNANCIAGSWDAETKWTGASIALIPGSQILVTPDTRSNGTLTKRATCSYTQAVGGDGCWALADRCKITQAKLVEYNGDANLCSQNKIQVGKYYCCSSGTLPDFTPQPNGDGTCKTHAVQSTDLCDTIAKKYSLTVQQLQDRNKNTWGWQGCQFLMKDQLLCVSTGAPPMPAVDPLATCGPTVKGSQRPSDMSKINELNPCPLKACCNVWGNCGISKDFCIKSPADTGAPGTTKPGANSCVASCGMTITNNASPPSSFMRVGYFEAWNLDRPCLHMLPRQIDLKFYTHLVRSYLPMMLFHILTCSCVALRLRQHIQQFPS
jgi:chitinase